MIRIFSLLLLVILTLPGTAMSKEYFSDSRLTRWAAMTLEGKTDTVLKSVEKDLVSPKPFIFSPYIWEQLHGGGANVREAYQKITNPQLRKVLAQWQDIAALDYEDRYREMLGKYPPASFGKKSNPMLLLPLQWAAMDQTRYTEALQYAEQALATGSDIFWIVWRTFNVFEEDERLRADFILRLKKGHILQDKGSKRFLLAMLEASPLTTEVMFTSINDWLKTHPRDPFALLFLAKRLNEMEKYEQAAKTFEEAARIFPFMTGTWDDHAFALRKLNRNDEADRVIVRSVRLRNLPDAEQQIGLRRYQLLVRCNDNAADPLLEELNRKWPDHEGLTAARIDLEMNEWHCREALEFARAFAERHPEKIQHQVQLLTVLHKAQREQEAHTLYRKIRATFPEITTTLYETAEELLNGESNAAELDTLREEYARQYPGSRRLPELKGDKLGKAGKNDEAINEYRRMFAINSPSRDQMRKYAAFHREKSGLAAAIAALDSLQGNIKRGSTRHSLAPELPTTEKVAAVNVPQEKSSNAIPRLVAQIGHEGVVNALALSPDKTLLASAGADGIVILRHLESGRELRRFIHKLPVRGLCFARDGKTLISGADDGIVRLWDPATGEQKKQQQVLEGKIYTLALSADGVHLLVGGTALSAPLLSFPVLEKLAKFDSKYAAITAAAFAPDGLRLATASVDGTVRLYDTSTTFRRDLLNGHRGPVTSLAFSADGRFLASGGADGTARLWHLASNVEIASVATGGTVQSLAPLQTGLAFIAGVEKEGAQLVDFNAGKVTRRSQQKDAETRAIAVIPGDRFLSAGNDGAICELSLADFAHVRTMKGLLDSRSPAGFSPDGNLLVTATTAGTVRLWSINGSMQQVEIRPAGTDTDVSWAFSSDGRHLAVYSRTGNVVVYNMAEERETSRLQLATPGIVSLLLSKNAQSLATFHDDGTLRLWDGSTAASRAKISRVSALGTPFAYTPDGNRLLVGSDDSLVYILDSRSGEIVRRFMLEGHDRGIVSIAVDSDGSQAAVSSLDGTVTAFDLQTMKLRKMPKNSGAEVALAFAPNSHKLVMTAPEGPVTIVDTDTGALEKLGEHSNAVDRLALSATGDYLLTGNSLEGERLWYLPEKREIASYKVDNQAFTNETFSPSGAFAAVPGDAGLIRIIATSTGAEVASMVSFSDGTWAVVAPDGRFDTNNLEDIKGLHWIMTDEPFTPLPVEAFMREYYEPRLLARLLSENPNLPAITSPLSLNRIQPEVTVDKIEPVPNDPSHVLVTVSAKQMERNRRVSGLRDLRLFRDGQLVGYADDNLPLTGNSFTKTFTVALPYVEGDKNNSSFTAYAFNSDRIKSASSPPITFFLPKGRPVRRAYIVAIGVGKYTDSKFDLQFPPADAISYIETLPSKIKGLGGFAKEDIIPVLLTNNGNWSMKNVKSVNSETKQETSEYVGEWINVTSNLPRRELIEGVFDLLAGRPVTAQIRDEIPGAGRLRAVTPDDVVIITYSGHGNTDNGKYYIATASPVTNSESYISSNLLSNWLRDIDAGNMTIIIDSCHSAAVVGTREFKPGPMGSRGLGQLAYDKGISILAASQADNNAEEYSMLKHGIMTYVLVEEGLKANRAYYRSKDGKITLKEWLTYAVWRVPKLQQSIKNTSFRSPVQEAKVQSRDDGGTLLGQNNALQQPALFDFRKEPRELILSQ
ncbi:putative WD repeat-containing protein alr3466 [Geobacter sp. OR-1]|uniref:caspase family protein n=1 Tax=Geobacter sp. OR-1 TaxID=1266765 RepID=UPI00054220F6|nr:caspase family protein [Geobacter sp. OR-1]GAM11186.1 putative WD repeat-containing protein alr3466 [Geobacter sp. OR-1]